MGKADAGGDVSHVSRFSWGRFRTHPGRSAEPANRCARFGRGVQAPTLPRRSIAEPTRSGGVADSYSRVEAYCPLPAWIVMEYSGANKRSGDGPANLLARDALYTEEVFRQAVALQLTIIEVNGSASVDGLATHVAQCLGIRRR